MRAVVQRVTFADVTVFDPAEVDAEAKAAGTYDGVYAKEPETSNDLLSTGRTVGGIPGGGLVVFLGVEVGDTESDASYLADKICGLRIFGDDEGKMNKSLLDFPDASILAISQFTLLGDARKGRRPSFIDAEKPERANQLYKDFVEKVTANGVQVEEGEFQADMLVRIHNKGPVTIMLDSRKKF
ncbi:MAG: D-aminoacyl-tRNA deacylase [Coriobacteriia bacterium]|nr:D-aminoacyl-tRNA deacylase [Coriobacteriia bacterium]MCL2750472.1 D-aminoacyl-tRNA deacylase [Coriobacteriia bacterium]